MGVVSDFKLKYWGHQPQDYILPSPHLGREYLVFGKLMIKLSEWARKGLLPDIYIRPTGVGTLTNVINNEHYHDLSDKYFQFPRGLTVVRPFTNDSTSKNLSIP